MKRQALNALEGKSRVVPSLLKSFLVLGPMREK